MTPSLPLMSGGIDGEVDFRGEPALVLRYSVKTRLWEAAEPRETPAVSRAYNWEL